jgi:predicted amidohydrolase
MPHTISIAAIQLDARPAPVIERLKRAEVLVIQAAATGAQIILLPEVFNTGYEYSDQNYACAESLNDSTVTWMLQTAANTGAHLAGTLFLRGKKNIYNAMLLVAPDGQIWRYDKRYPWSWERAYFQPGRGVTVAETSLGRLGMLICWDVAHPRLWAQYAGQVDAILICSCPPAIPSAIPRFPDGSQFKNEHAGPLFRRMARNTEQTFSKLLLRQAAWLGVPVAQAGVTGQFSSTVPLPGLTLAPFLFEAPRYWRRFSQLKHTRLEAGFFPTTFIADASGQVLAEAPIGIEGYSLATVSCADTQPRPQVKQPPYGLSPVAYWMDSLNNRLLARYYRKNMQPYNNPSVY